LSNGSIFRTTSCTPAQRDRQQDGDEDADASSTRRRPPRAGSTNGASRRAKNCSSQRSSLPGPCPCAPASWRVNFSASHGVIMKATASEITIPMLALMGIGLM